MKKIGFFSLNLCHFGWGCLCLFFSQYPFKKDRNPKIWEITYLGLGKGGSWELLNKIAHQEYSPCLKAAKRNLLEGHHPWAQYFTKRIFCEEI